MIKHAEMKGKSIDLLNSSKGGSKHEHFSGEASEDQSEKEDEDEDENSVDDEENSSEESE